MRSEKAVKSTAGGSAAERGLDFQARASAIVMAHLLAERPIGCEIRCFAYSQCEVSTG